VAERAASRRWNCQTKTGGRGREVVDDEPEKGWQETPSWERGARRACCGRVGGTCRMVLVAGQPNMNGECEAASGMTCGEWAGFDFRSNQGPLRALNKVRGGLGPGMVSSCTVETSCS